MPLSGNALRSHGSIYGARAPGPVDNYSAPFAMSDNPFNTDYNRSDASFPTWSETDHRAVITDTDQTVILRVGYGITQIRAFQFEVMTAGASGTMRIGFRLGPVPGASTSLIGSLTGEVEYSSDAFKRIANVETAYGATYTSGDKITGIYNGPVGSFEFWKNGVSQGVINAGLFGDYYPGFKGATSADVRVSATSSYALGAAAYWR